MKKTHVFFALALAAALPLAADDDDYSRALYPAVSVTSPTADFTERDMRIDDGDGTYETWPVILEAGGGTGAPLLVKVTLDWDGERTGYALPACPFSRSGYTFAGWEAYNPCCVSADSYVFRKGSESAGGSYDGTFQPGFLYLICGSTAFRAAWKKNGGGAVDVPARWQRARTLQGAYGELAGQVAGTVQVKCGKANRSGIAKVSMAITPFSGKKRKFRAVAVDVSRKGALDVVWPGESYELTIDGDSFWGGPAGSDNCDTWDAELGGELRKTAYFTFEEDGGYWKEEYLEYMERVKEFSVYDWFVDNSKIAEAFYRTPVYMNGRKWTFEKNATVKRTSRWAGSEWPWAVPNCIGCVSWYLNTAGGSKMNIHSLKLSYSYKTGMFKGGYIVFDHGKVKATVKGAVLDGTGYATVSAKGHGTWTVEFR